MKKVYLASPFFDDKQIEALSRAEASLRSRGLDVFSPREHEVREGNVGNPIWSLETFKMDSKAIDCCDIVVMLYWGNYSDSGTAWECGYAYSKGKPVVVVHLGDSSNLMIHEGSYSNVNGLEGLEKYDFDSMPMYRFSGKMF